MNTTKKILYILALLLCVNVVGQAQSVNAETKADERVAAINDQIKSVDPELVLTPEQVKIIKELHIKRTEEIRAVKKSNLTDQEKKAKSDAAIKAFNQKLSKEVLTKPQKNARRKASKGGQ